MENLIPLCDEIISMYEDNDRGVILSCAERYCEKNVLTEEELGLFVPALKGCAVIAIAEEVEKDSDEEMAKLFSLLRYLSSSDISESLFKLSRIEKVLLRDPAGVYADMADESRSMYRSAVVSLSKKYGISEEDALKMVTINPAKMLHVDDRVGSIKEGKDAIKRLPFADTISAYSGN